VCGLVALFIPRREKQNKKQERGNEEEERKRLDIGNVQTVGEMN
jgi:hypothetical protein